MNAPAPGPSGKVTVASLVPAATDLLLAMGARDRLVAVSNWDAVRPEIAGLPRVGDYRTADWEKIVELRPAVMIVQFHPDKMPAGLRERAAAAGIRLVNVRIVRLDDVFTTIDLLGDTIGEPARAAETRRQLRDRLDAVRRRVAGRPPVRTFVARTATGLDTVGGGNFLDDVLTIAGGENVVRGGENSFPTVDLEMLASFNPDAVLQLLPGASEQVVAQAKSFWPTLPQLAAVRGGRVYLLTDSHFLVPGFNLGRVAEQFADRLHPETIETRTGATTPSPLYSGERAGVRGGSASSAPCQGRGNQDPRNGHSLLLAGQPRGGNWSSAAPTALTSSTPDSPTAHAVGYGLPPLRGSGAIHRVLP